MILEYIKIGNQLYIPIFILILFVILYMLKFHILVLNKSGFSEKMTILKYFIILILISLILVGLIFDIVEFYLSIKEKETSFIFVLLNALILGMYINVCGFSTSFNSKYHKYLAIFIIIAVVISLFGYIGILIELNFNFLFYNQYESNSIKGILFMTYNQVYIFLIYASSFLIEQDIEKP